jgi:hypothetical protein
MSDTLSFAEIDAQHLELLPARTVLSMMMITKLSGGSNANGGTGTGVGVGGTNINTQLNNVGVLNHGNGHVIGGSQQSFQSADGTGVGVGGSGGFAHAHGHGHGIASANGANGGNGTGIGLGGINVNTQLNNVGVVNWGNGNVIGGNQSSFQSANGTGVGVGGPGGFAFSGKH